MVDETFGVACAVVYIAMTRIESGRRMYTMTWMRSTAPVVGMLKVELSWVVRCEVHRQCWEMQVMR
jgi:hypothetical protein